MSNPPDPRYSEWDKRSRRELKERLYDAVDKRRDATQELIPKVIEEELNKYGMAGINNELYAYAISAENVMRITHELINKQIDEWKGLRWRRFNDKNICDCWSKWFKKAKCWQDQNQHKPLGQFWCLIFDELKQFTSNISSKCKIKLKDLERVHQIQQCLYNKCILSILKGSVKFERTRETPLLPVRVLTQSKALQQKLFTINNGYTLLLWKQNATQKHKANANKKEANKKRSNIATLLNEKCLKHATNIYQTSLNSLNMNHMNMNNNNNCNGLYGYGPRRGPGPGPNAVSVSVSQRYSPIASLPSPSPSPSCNKNESFELSRLSMENKQLRAELAEIRKELSDKRENTLQAWVQQNTLRIDTIIRQQNSAVPSPMMIPPAIHSQLSHANGGGDGDGDYGIYDPPNGTMFYFPSKKESDATNNAQKTATPTQTPTVTLQVPVALNAIYVVLPN